MTYTILNQRFGIEIETAGCDRAKIAQAIKTVVNGTISSGATGGYNATVIRQRDGREWKVQNDGSIATLHGRIGSEIVSPILTYDDIPTLKLIITAVKAAGAIPHRSCGVHIHTDASMHNATSLTNLAKMVYRNEEMLFQAIGTSTERQARYTKPMEQDFIDRLVNRKPNNMSDINRAWYGRQNLHPDHYDNSRYYASPNIMWSQFGTAQQ